LLSFCELLYHPYRHKLTGDRVSNLVLQSRRDRKILSFLVSWHTECGNEFTPAWPDVRPQNAWCLPQGIFVPHIDRVLSMLGLPVESRTSMITSWLPSISRHKNIVSLNSFPKGHRAKRQAYRSASLTSGHSELTARLLSPEQLAPSTQLRIIPPPQVLLRIFVSTVFADAKQSKNLMLRFSSVQCPIARSRNGRTGASCMLKWGWTGARCELKGISAIDTKLTGVFSGRRICRMRRCSE